MSKHGEVLATATEEHRAAERSNAGIAFLCCFESQALSRDIGITFTHARVELETMYATPDINGSVRLARSRQESI